MCGVDEAGKGAVLGPLVIAAVGAADPAEFEGLGFKDSKVLSPEKRKDFCDLICSRFPFTVHVIGPDEIDLNRRQMNMNAIMAKAHARVINDIGASIAYVDACDVNAARYGWMVRNSICRDCHVISEHHADRNRPLVSAASIVAKVFRDEAVLELGSTYGQIGSGYPSDRVTVAFLKDYLSTFGKPPLCARASWQTVRTLVAIKEQSDLSCFFC